MLRGYTPNYDTYGGVRDDVVDASGLFGLRAFQGKSVMETTGLLQWRSAGGRHDLRITRLDSTFTHVWPEQGIRLSVGDLITGSVAWSRPTRLGGVQIGTDFALQPYVPTAPAPAFFGSATLPSQVELFVDGIRRWSGDVKPGAFAIGTGPGHVDGQGQAQIVMTDVLGRVSTQEFRFYETPQLLREGLDHWSAAAGTVRIEYGDLSLGYADEPVIAGSWRRGISDRLTLETHAEAGLDQAVAGFGAAWLLGTAGVLTGSISGSFGRNEGLQWTLGYSLTSGNFNFSANLRRATRGFGDIAGRWTFGPPLAVDNIQLGYRSRALGTFGLGYLRLATTDNAITRYAMANWSRWIIPGLTINANVRQNLARGADRSAFVSLNFSPRGSHHASLGMQVDNGAYSYAATYQQNAPSGGGLGWRGDISSSAGQLHGQAQINWLGDHGEAQARLEARPAGLSGHASASGSLVVFGGSVFASRQIEDGFALITTGEAAGVPVLVHNRPAGKTDRNGRLLVTQLNPFQENRIGIDTASLDESYAVEAVSGTAVPSDRSGVRLDFRIRKVNSAVATIVDTAGRPFPAGALAWIEGLEEPVTTGFDGLLYIEEPSPGAKVRIELDGRDCAFDLPPRIAPGNQVDLGKIVCMQVRQ
jgi:outer membrane usher protein